MEWRDLRGGTSTASSLIGVRTVWVDSELDRDDYSSGKPIICVFSLRGFVRVPSP